jgi:predicted DNA-binding transcriptional regulator AlpA
MPVPNKHQIDRRAGELIKQLNDTTADPDQLCNANTDPDQLLDTKATAKLLAMSTEWVELGRHYGYGPRYLKLSPRRIRYRRSDILSWLNERAHASTREYATTGGRPRKREGRR